MLMFSGCLVVRLLLEINFVLLSAPELRNLLISEHLNASVTAESARLCSFAQVEPLISVGISLELRKMLSFVKKVNKLTNFLQGNIA